MDRLIQSIEQNKAELDRLVARAPGGLRNFHHVQDLELTYTSNAIEGNTLTAAETTLVVEKGITIGGKPLKDHLEASITSKLCTICAHWPGRPSQ